MYAIQKQMCLKGYYMKERPFAGGAHVFPSHVWRRFDIFTAVVLSHIERFQGYPDVLGGGFAENSFTVASSENLPAVDAEITRKSRCQLSSYLKQLLSDEIKPLLIFGCFRVFNTIMF